eukprot:4263786-Amphidinium_carterae.1
MMHALYEVRAIENNIPPEERLPWRDVAPLPEQQHGVFVHGYTGTPHFRMYEPPVSIIESIYRDPQREYMDQPGS